MSYDTSVDAPASSYDTSVDAPASSYVALHALGADVGGIVATFLWGTRVWSAGYVKRVTTELNTAMRLFGRQRHATWLCGVRDHAVRLVLAFVTSPSECATRRYIDVRYPSQFDDVAAADDADADAADAADADAEQRRMWATLDEMTCSRLGLSRTRLVRFDAYRQLRALYLDARVSRRTFSKLSSKNRRALYAMAAFLGFSTATVRRAFKPERYGERDTRLGRASDDFLDERGERRLFRYGTLRRRHVHNPRLWELVHRADTLDECVVRVRFTDPDVIHRECYRRGGCRSDDDVTLVRLLPPFQF
jgi:hypothetical protein